MFGIKGKTDLSQISLTGLRALVFIGLLIVKPRSLDEIKRAFIELNIMEESHSDDILRIDLNTIKTMGCDISRCSQKTDYKYILYKHPFALKFTLNEVKVLKKAYNKIRKEISFFELIKYHDLFEKIAFHTADEEVKEAILGISILKYYNIKDIKDLIEDCKVKRVVKLTYQKTDSRVAYEKNVIAQELVFKNDKLYLYGYDKDYERPTILNLKRMHNIISRTFQSEKMDFKSTKIKFLYKNSDLSKLESKEVVLENKDNMYLVEGTYHNDFVATQRVLNLGIDCVVLEPVEFRNTIINKIKEMRKVYGN